MHLFIHCSLQNESVSKLVVGGENMSEEVIELNDKELEKLKEAFTLFDRNRDGEISAEELGKVRKK